MSLDKEKPIIWNVRGYELQITHPNKVYWPKEGYTKLDILQYYFDMAPTLLPYFKDRPVTLHYFPKGIEELSFYKRNFEDEEEDENLFHTIAYEEISQDKTIRVPLIDSAAGLLFFASRGGFEFHLWSSKATNYSYPDMAIFDFDVNENVAFETVLQAASYLNELLNSMNLKSYPKTTGGSGLHVYVPIVPKYSFKEVREWVKRINDTLAKKYPNLITTQKKSKKTHISNKVTVDYLQNVISRNTAAPYTVRAYPNAPVSAPLTWKEVKNGGFLPKDFNIKTMPKRVEKLGDLFSEVLSIKQQIKIG
ncbi:non-homologous end-joining DNA ligase [Polaribacter litorisediminis]|uniref:non-homologous end-joining DNA ligase n=1 Tax=Polaribacter litorisediminis TaxID=1908341 RepID=UPI001CBD9437|nr:non-homologous end-joining DNA ligase [Polaribacter litorisediminis]UAM98568.1 non-homologous end-joining DNA ligase [Polaribacter litorisediminis]